jgi:hypothetical protein
MISFDAEECSSAIPLKETLKNVPHMSRFVEVFKCIPLVIFMYIDIYIFVPIYVCTYMYIYNNVMECSTAIPLKDTLRNVPHMSRFVEVNTC